MKQNSQIEISESEVMVFDNIHCWTRTATSLNVMTTFAVYMKIVREKVGPDWIFLDSKLYQRLVERFKEDFPQAQVVSELGTITMFVLDEVIPEEELRVYFRDALIIAKLED